MQRKHLIAGGILVAVVIGVVFILISPKESPITVADGSVYIRKHGGGQYVNDQKWNFHDNNYHVVSIENKCDSSQNVDVASKNWLLTDASGTVTVLTTDLGITVTASTTDKFSGAADNGTDGPGVYQATGSCSTNPKYCTFPISFSIEGTAQPPFTCTSPGKGKRKLTLHYREMK